MNWEETLGSAETALGELNKSIEMLATYRDKATADITQYLRVQKGIDLDIDAIRAVPTQPYSGAHFATYPAELVEPCIKAGTSERGCCSQCGTPWVRVTEKNNPANDGETSTQYPKGSSANRLAMKRQAARARGEEFSNKVTTWQPGCKCNTGTAVPCMVFDPFSGSGTTAMVARSGAMPLDLISAWRTSRNVQDGVCVTVWTPGRTERRDRRAAINSTAYQCLRRRLE
jgi:hypothetical protein